MTLELMKYYWLALVSLLVAVPLRAQDIDLVGDASWRQYGSQLRISAERIDNNRDVGTSGYLRLQIWGTSNIYDGLGDITGYSLGTFNLGGLPAGAYFANLNRLVRYYPPPPGLYYTTMTLEEETVDGSFYIVDSENFPGVVNFGKYGEGSANLGSNGDVGFFGYVSWLAGGGRVQFYAEEILNQRASGRTGVLRARLWATSTPYDGGVLQGHPMATTKVGRVYAGSFLPNYSRYASFRPPPSGEYYVTMTLEELVRGYWDIVDFHTFEGRSIF